MSAKPNRNEQRRARALATADGVPYNEALRRLRNQASEDLLRSGQELERIFDQSGFDVVDVFRGEIAVDLEALALHQYGAALRIAERGGLGLLCRAIRLVGLAPPNFKRERGYASSLATSARRCVGQLDEDGFLVEPEDAAAMFYDGPTAAFCRAIHDWLGHDHPQRLATLAGGTFRGAPPVLPGTPSIRELLIELDQLAAGQLLDAEALAAVREPLTRVLIVEAN